MPKRWLFLVFGAGAPVCISLASIVPILVCILPLVLVLWESAPLALVLRESAPLALVLHIGPVLITATPAVPVYATLHPASLLARRFAFSASSARLDKSTPKRNSFEVSFAYCWVVQMTR